MVKLSSIIHKNAAVETICAGDVTNSILIVIYILLFLFCMLLFRENASSMQSGQSGGLLWYLGCTSLLCVCRFTGFALVPYTSTDSSIGCRTGYHMFEWELYSGGDTTSSLYLELLILSTSSSALFFSSYSYFAHSLSKVLDMLTTDENTTNSSLKYSLLLVALNASVWCSLFLLWLARFFNFPGAGAIDNLAQFSLATAALTTCITFGLHFRRVYYFLRRNDGSDSRVAEVSALLKLRRVLGVCSVCTVCFAVRSLLLLCHIPLGPVQADLYFIFTEVLPTAFMLNAFRNSSGSDGSIELGGGGQSPSSRDFQALGDSFSGLENYFEKNYSMGNSTLTPMKIGGASMFSYFNGSDNCSNSSGNNFIINNDSGSGIGGYNYYENSPNQNQNASRNSNSNQNQNQNSSQSGSYFSSMTDYSYNSGNIKTSEKMALLPFEDEERS